MATTALTDAFERIARSMPNFCFGRIDVRFETLPTLLRFESFRIIEINGTGSEPTHIWDPTRSLWDAWCAQFFLYGTAFWIGAENRSRGFRTSGVRSMYRLWRHQNRLMAAYPMND